MTKRKFRTFNEARVERYKKHPRELKSYIQVALEEYQKDGDEKAFLSALSVAARGHWVEAQNGNALRCNWRLIEQPMPVIEQAIARAIAALPPEGGGFDLFGTPFAAG